MHHHDDVGATLLVVFVLANLVIVAGYVIVPFTLLGRKVPMTRPVRIAGILFFATCALTHLSMALFWPLWWALVASHVVQACSVWYFVLGFSRLIRDADAKRRPGDPAAGQDPGPVGP